MMCRLLDVSSSGYYAGLSRAPSARKRSDAMLTERIGEIHARCGGTYGAPRVHAELREEGERVGRHRVARLMRRADLQGVSRRRGVRTTVRSMQGASAPDLVDRNFEVTGPDRLWVADITYVPTWTG